MEKPDNPQPGDRFVLIETNDYFPKINEVLTFSRPPGAGREACFFRDANGREGLCIWKRLVPYIEPRKD
jgi:hypothetical protein